MKKISKRIACFFILFLSFYIASPSIDRSLLVCCPIDIFANKKFLIKHTEGVWGRDLRLSEKSGQPLLKGDLKYPLYNPKRKLNFLSLYSNFIFGEFERKSSQRRGCLLLRQPLCSAKRLRRSFSHREGVVSQRDNDRYLGDTTPEWAYKARIAGYAVEPDEGDKEIDEALESFKEQNVSVLIADCPIGWDYSAWHDEDEFKKNLKLIKKVVEKAHEKGLKVVWYLTGLEVTGKGREPSKENPDWMQISIEGKPIAFNDISSEEEHWLEKGEYDAWLSPCSPYKEFYLKRVEEIVKTGVDGIWNDVVYLQHSIGHHENLWPSHDAYSKRRFKEETGFETPRKENWDDYVWRRWILWRYEKIKGFLVEIKEKAKRINPEIVVFEENWNGDSPGSTLYANDPAMFFDVKDIYTGHEVSTIGDRVDLGEKGMKEASLKEWVAFSTMIKFARACDGEKPSWILTYGYKPDDAERMAGIIISNGANYYETQGPSMAETVGDEYRERIFSWIKENEKYFYKSRSMAEVALLYSSRSRDFGDRGEGDFYDIVCCPINIFSNKQFLIKHTEGVWGRGFPMSGGCSAKRLRRSFSHREGVMSQQNNKRCLSDMTLGDSKHFKTYRETSFYLHRNFIPFDIVVENGLSLETLLKYKFLILPEANYLEDNTIDVIKKFTEKGRKIIIIGESGNYDGIGNPRKENPLKDLTKRELKDINFSPIKFKKEYKVIAELREGKDFICFSVVDLDRKPLKNIEVDLYIPLKVIEVLKKSPDGKVEKIKFSSDKEKISFIIPEIKTFAIIILKTKEDEIQIKKNERASEEKKVKKPKRIFGTVLRRQGEREISFGTSYDILGKTIGTSGEISYTSSFRKWDLNVYSSGFYDIGGEISSKERSEAEFIAEADFPLGPAYFLYTNLGISSTKSHHAQEGFLSLGIGKNIVGFWEFYGDMELWKPLRPSNSPFFEMMLGTGIQKLTGDFLITLQAESSFPMENFRKPGYSINVGFSYFWKIFEFGVFSEFNHDPEKGSNSSLEIFLWIGF
ncbi:MAG: family 10 glycosylhydrolase [Acidobacteriota bacterium]